MTEKDCLNYCYKNGYKWLEDGKMLYGILDRVSCWCCANKNNKELDNMWIYLPNYWKKRVELFKQIKKNNKRNCAVVKNAEKYFIKMF